jgi:hypothetical protein
MDFGSKVNIDLISGINQRCIPGSVRFFSIFFPLRLLQHWGREYAVNAIVIDENAER